jgi:trk system potassium uptake protein TrkH
MLMSEEARRESKLGTGFWVLGILSGAALLPVLVEHGGGNLSPGTFLLVRLTNFAFVSVFLAEFLLGLIRAPDRRLHLRTGAVEFLLFVGLGLTFVLITVHPFGFFEVRGLSGFLIPVQVYLFGNFIVKLLGLFKVVARRRFNYARAFGISFVAIIGAGALLLFLLPGTKAPGKDLSLIDALFTSTSATCVTGLVTVDTGSHYSRFGQTIILILFQVGGLGIMTFAAFFAIALGKGMGIRDRDVMRGVLNLEVMGKIVKVVVGILVITVLFEAVGAAVLYQEWPGDLAPHDRLFNSIFHSVSAFCNAGFSLMSNSLEGFVGNPVVNITVMTLVVVGGLGFGVLLELVGLPIFGIRFLSRFRRWDDPFPEVKRPRLGLQSRIVLLSTLVLLFGGAVLFLVFERKNPATLGDLSGGEQAQAALFASVTSRTAGFNTFPVGEMTDASKFLTVGLMMIGAAPGSTGGGVKTVTAVVLLVSVLSVLRGRNRVELFRRTIPPATVQRAGIIVVTSIAFVFVATLILTMVEAERFSFMDIFFEVGSAFGTVGLSTGITAELSGLSKLTLCVIMLVGRIGPLSLVIALSQGGASRRYEYPQENVMIG